MGTVGVVLPQFTRRPVFIEEKVRGVLVILVQVVLKAPVFRYRRRYEPLQLRQDEFLLARIGRDAGNDGEFGHSISLVM